MLEPTKIKPENLPLSFPTLHATATKPGTVTPLVRGNTCTCGGQSAVGWIMASDTRWHYTSGPVNRCELCSRVWPQEVEE